MISTFGDRLETRIAEANDAKLRRSTYKLKQVNRKRKIELVGEVVLSRLERGLWDEREFRQMMDEALTRPGDRALFELE